MTLAETLCGFKQHIILNFSELAKDKRKSVLVSTLLQSSKLICNIILLLAEITMQFWSGKYQCTLVHQNIFTYKLNTSEPDTSIISLLRLRMNHMVLHDRQSHKLWWTTLVPHCRHFSNLSTRQKVTLHTVTISEVQCWLIIFHLFTQTCTKILQWLIFTLGIPTNCLTINQLGDLPLLIRLSKFKRI